MTLLSSFFSKWRHAVLLCTLLLTLYSYCNGQSEAYTKFKEDSLRVEELITRAMKQTDPDISFLLLKDLLKKSLITKNNYGINNALLLLGQLYLNKGDYDKAMSYTKQSISYHEGLPLISWSNSYQHLGWIYSELGDYVTAAENYYLALDYLKQSGLAQPNYVSIYNNLGEVYFRLHQKEKAMQYYNLGEEYARLRNWQNCVAPLLYNKGEYYLSMNELDSARRSYKKVYDIGTRTERADIKAMGSEGIGKTYIASGDYNKATGYLLSAIHLSENSCKAAWVESSFYLGEAWYKLKKYRQAEEVLLPALKETGANKQKDNVVKGYTTLTLVYKAIGQYQKALECMDSLNVLKDSLVNGEKVKAINFMDIKFQTAEKDKAIANSKLMIAMQNNKMAHRNTWMLFVGACILLLLMLSAGGYFYILNRQRSADKENKIGVLKAAVQGGDSERGRIARELHEGIGGMLSAAMMRFSSIHHDNAEIVNTPAYTDAMGILREMGEEIRKTAHSLMPDVLLKQSLSEAMRVYCNNVKNSGVLQVDFQSYGSFDDLEPELKLNLYRIVQELVKNVIQHAGATRAMVQLLRNENVLIVGVEDNGKGFKKNDIKHGQGLFNTQTRVSSLDGTFTLESTPGKGTSVFIEITTGLPVENTPSNGRLIFPNYRSFFASKSSV